MTTRKSEPTRPIGGSFSRRIFVKAAAAASLSTGPLVNSVVRASAALVNPRIVHQRFEGWGTSLAWWAHVVGGFPPKIRHEYLTKIFHPHAGLGLTVARYNIGGGENPKYKFLSYRAAIPGYAPHPGQFDWHADARQRLILRACLDMGVTQIQAFSNSPPYYMTRSGSVTGARDGGSNLRPECFGAFADYLAQVVAHFDRVWGIRFQTVEAFNEPTSMWWQFGGPQEGCHIGNREQNIIIPMLARALRECRVPTGIAAPDDNNIDETISSIAAYTPETRAILDQIDTHSYSGNHRSTLRKMAAAAHKRLWMSEYGDGDASGLTMAARIIQDMKELQPLAWVYWQAVDINGWGLLANPEDGHDTRYTLPHKYYVMAQFSRFIRPGCWFIQVDDPHCIAAYAPDVKRLVIVAVNRSLEKRAIQFDLSAFSMPGAPVRTYVTAPGHKLSFKFEIHSRGALSTTIPPEGTKTFVINDCRVL